MVIPRQSISQHGASLVPEIHALVAGYRARGPREPLRRLPAEYAAGPEYAFQHTQPEQPGVVRSFIQPPAGGAYA